MTGPAGFLESWSRVFCRGGRQSTPLNLAVHPCTVESSLADCAVRASPAGDDASPTAVQPMAHIARTSLKHRPHCAA